LKKTIRLKNSILLLTILYSLCFTANANKKDLSVFIDEYLSIKYNRSYKNYLFISIRQQKLFHIIDGSISESYPISTAKNGAGNEMNSGKTPTGLHVIEKKVGSNLPNGAILNERVFDGKIASIYQDSTNLEKDEITSRILWLNGQEEGYNRGGNVDSYYRYIYIHGTPEEGLIGQPVSHGCIRMLNEDVIRLYNSVHINTPVLILNF